MQDIKIDTYRRSRERNSEHNKPFGRPKLYKLRPGRFPFLRESEKPQQAHGSWVSKVKQSGSQ